MGVPREKEITKAIDRNQGLFGVGEGGPTETLRWTPEEEEDNQGKMNCRIRRRECFLKAQGGGKFL